MNGLGKAGEGKKSNRSLKLQEYATSYFNEIKYGNSLTEKIYQNGIKMGVNKNLLGKGCRIVEKHLRVEFLTKFCEIGGRITRLDVAQMIFK